MKRSYPKPTWAIQQLIRRDKGGLVEDVCRHGVGHPNHAWVDAHDDLYAGIHGCDGCCSGKGKQG